MKLVLLGPVYPYKGGISHYTGLMCRALAKKHEVVMVSYKLQYPSFLFKKEQKDCSNDNFKIEDTRFWLNTMNPFNWIQTARNIKQEKPDAIIVQWWHPYFAPCYYGLSKLLKNVKILYVCHNVFPHERFPMDRALCKMALKQGNYFVTQSQMDAKDLLSIIECALHVVTPHPTYNAFKIKNMQEKEARERLNIKDDVPLLLFFGFVREYKGLKYLINAMPSIRLQIPKVKLLIVGDFGEDKDAYFQRIQELNVGECIDVVEGYIPDGEVEKYFAASDLIVLPYTSATQSGIVQIAYGFEKPVVVTNVGGLPDVVTDGMTGAVVEPMNQERLAEEIVLYFKENRKSIYIENIKKEAYRFSWDRIVTQIENLLE